MYAVIRSGGKQYRVAPGDLIRVERLGGASGRLETSEVLAVRDDAGLRVAPQDVRITAAVVEQGKAAKVLVFHYKRKKQYKKLAGHRQPYTALRITGIEVGGKQYAAEAAKAK